MDTINPCRCCLFQPAKKDLKTPYEHLGIAEIYSDMIEECFAIELTFGNNEEGGICEECVSRLRDAFDFKMQVQRSQEELQARLASAADIKDAETEFVTVDGDDYMEHMLFEDPSVKPELVYDVGANEECIVMEEPPVKAEISNDATNDDDDTLNNFLVEELSAEFGALEYATNDDPVDGFLVPLHEAKAVPAEPGCDELEQVRARQQLAMACSVRLERLRDAAAPHACPNCPRTFDHAMILALHIHHHDKYENKLKKPDYTTENRTKSSHNCHTCGKSYTTKGGLDFHLKFNGPYWCEVCSKMQCDRRQHDLTHTGGIHLINTKSKKIPASDATDTTQLKVFKCDQCDMQFIVKWKLIVHKKRAHNTTKPFSCYICSKAFKAAEELNLHKRRHPKHFLKCSACHMKFLHKSRLDRHMEVSHNTKKLHTCDICEIHFESMYELYLHIRSHTGQKPFSCKVCQKKFSYRVDLIQHIQKHANHVEIH